MGRLDRGAQKRIHELIARHGMDDLAVCLPSEKPWEPCDFCEIRDPQSPKIPPTDGTTSNLPTDSAGGNPCDVVPPQVQPEKDLEQPLVEPNIVGAPSLQHTEDFGRRGWIENQDDQDLVDKLKKECEL